MISFAVNCTCKETKLRIDKLENERNAWNFWKKIILKWLKPLAKNWNFKKRAVLYLRWKPLRTIQNMSYNYKKNKNIQAKIFFKIHFARKWCRNH